MRLFKQFQIRRCSYKCSNTRFDNETNQNVNICKAKWLEYRRKMFTNDYELYQRSLEVFW